MKLFYGRRRSDRSFLPVEIGNYRFNELGNSGLDYLAIPERVPSIIIHLERRWGKVLDWGGSKRQGMVEIFILETLVVEYVVGITRVVISIGRLS